MKIQLAESIEPIEPKLDFSENTVFYIIVVPKDIHWLNCINFTNFYLKLLFYSATVPIKLPLFKNLIYILFDI